MFYLIWGICGLLYLAVNSIIMLIWMSDNDYKKKWKPVVVITLMLFGLPIVVVVLTVVAIMTAVELIRMRIRKEEQ